MSLIKRLYYEVNMTSGDLKITGGLSSGSIRSDNISGAATLSNLSVTGMITGANIITNSITTSNLNISGTLTVTNITVNNLLQSSGSINITASYNTIGSIITSGGNIGIGTTAPQVALHVIGDILSTGTVTRSLPYLLYTIASDQSIPTASSITVNWTSLVTGTPSNLSLTHSNGVFTYSGSLNCTLYINFSLWLTSVSASGLFYITLYQNGNMITRTYYNVISGISLTGNFMLGMSNGNNFSISVSTPAGTTANVNSSGSPYTWLEIVRV